MLATAAGAIPQIYLDDGGEYCWNNYRKPLEREPWIVVKVMTYLSPESPRKSRRSFSEDYPSETMPIFKHTMKAYYSPGLTIPAASIGYNYPI